MSPPHRACTTADAGAKLARGSLPNIPGVWIVHAKGSAPLASDLDHIVRHAGNIERFWDESNWAGRCKAHHSSKTAREVGFGG
jgi:hypothetical protein